MPTALNPRAREHKISRTRDSAPPAKKTKLSQPPAPAHQNGLKALVSGSSVPRPMTKLNGVKSATRDRVDEVTAAVGGGQAGHGDVDMGDAGQEVIEISSTEEKSDYTSSEHEEESDQDEKPNSKDSAQADEIVQDTNGVQGGDGIAQQDGTPEPEDLSFGDRLRVQHPEPVHEPRIVDVESAFAGTDVESKALAAVAIDRPLSTPNASSLGTVLTQALRTNDTELLDSCLRVIDVDTIYATVERLPSPLVGNLLQRLAERLHKKPGRAGMLMVWVQWSLAAHGAYLASQPQLVQQLTTLNKVLRERASGLQPLLALKGRLDMLQAQLELRRRNQKRAANDDEDEAVIYVEGEDDYVSSVDGDDMEITEGNPGVQNWLQGGTDDKVDDESSIDGMPTTMEVDDDDNSEEGSENSDGLLDDEAEETDDDLGDDISEPTSDGLNDGESVSGSEEESKPERRSTATRTGLKGRH